jgi:hypothetical protein
METLPFVLALIVGGASLLVGAWLSHWRWTRRLGLQGSPESHPKAITHRWKVASREESAAGTRVVYRCEECGALEVREMP